MPIYNITEKSNQMVEQMFTTWLKIYAKLEITLTTEYFILRFEVTELAAATPLASAAAGGFSVGGKSKTSESLRLPTFALWFLLFE